MDISESRLVELKAKVENLYSARRELDRLKAPHIGTFHQIDTYFDVPEGRLKLREIEGRKEAELIYYEREDTAEPKKSSVFILRISEPKTFKVLLEKVLDKKVIVDKKREIYRYTGTQIHLDAVSGLGNFIEFERNSGGSAEDIRKDEEVLGKLMSELAIQEENLVKESYSDLVLRGGKDA